MLDSVKSTVGYNWFAVVPWLYRQILLDYILRHNWLDLELDEWHWICHVCVREKVASSAITSKFIALMLALLSS